MKLLPYLQAGRREAGCDEAGRGCLAGPVFAAAVILPPDFYHPLVRDSKQLSAEQRFAARSIVEAAAISWAVGECSADEIDEINIFQASYRAMHRAISQLLPLPEHLLVDGKFFVPYPGLDHDCIIKGDGKYLAIAAAGILAKTYRDEQMLALHQTLPAYGWARNQGYPTKAHREAIRNHGPSDHHRLSFQLLPKVRPA